MGLDIYLKKYDNFDETKKLEDKYEKESSKIWDFNGRKYEVLTAKEKEEASKKCKEFAIKIGLNENGSDEDNEKSIELNSKKYPKHLFKIGYFRSSYNDGGFNSVVRNFIGKDLYHIFNPGDKYELKPDWKEAKKEAKQMLKELKDKIKDSGAYRVIEVYHNGFKNKDAVVIDTREKALKKFLDEKKEERSFGSFSNYYGEFFLKRPLEVEAIIKGEREQVFNKGSIPCSYVIYKDTEGLKWYIEALEIVIETIDYVLSKKDSEKYILHWSG